MVKKIAYLGIPGSYSHQASVAISPDYEHVGLPQFRSIFQAVEDGNAECGVVPVDNALSGRVVGIYTELAKEYAVNIIQEYILPIHLSLLVSSSSGIAQDGRNIMLDSAVCDYADIQEVFTHPQAFMQCDRFLKKYLPHAALREASDTANAAYDIGLTKSSTIAAVASSICASLYGLNILNENIEDDPGNATRFLVLSKQGFEGSAATYPSITTILFETRHEPGSLVGALGAFSDQGINLTKLETYMASRERRKPTFYVDVGDHLFSDRMQLALQQFKEHVGYWKILGTYPASPQRGVVSGFLTV
jgi:prephenate dehydratase